MKRQDLHNRSADKQAARAGRKTTARRRSRRVVPGLVMFEERTLLSTFTVTKTGDGDEAGTLRWAIDHANADDQANTIDFSPTAFATARTVAPVV